MEGPEQGKECREDNEENKGRVRNKIRRERQGRKRREKNKGGMDKGRNGRQDGDEQN